MGQGAEVIDGRREQNDERLRAQLDAGHDHEDDASDATVIG